MMYYAYRDGECVGSANLIGRERMQEEYPELEWLSEEEHDQREALNDKRAATVFDIFQEMEASIGNFNTYTEGLFNA